MIHSIKSLYNFSRGGSGEIVTQRKRMPLRQHFNNYERGPFVFVGVGVGVGVGGVVVVGPYDTIYTYIYFYLYLLLLLLLLLPLG